MPGGKYGDKL